jgi:23S rRNA (pseudouridine1915-N3)-methyltransferase
MRLDIVAIGQMRGTSEEDLVDTYCDRALKAGRQIGVDGPYISEIKERKGRTGSAKQREESALLQTALDARSGVVVMLDETGKQMTSRDFAKQVTDWQDKGTAQVTFVLGGADGLTPELRQRADLTLSLSKMTWPHMLARALLCEQIWRALSILTNHPYHRD